MKPTDNGLALLVTFPYGMLADRIGRKPTAVFAYVGLAISFSFTPLLFGEFQNTLRRNPYILMTGSLWVLLGGGVPVLLNTLYAIAADVSTEEQKYVQVLHQDTNFMHLTGDTERQASCISHLAPRLAASLVPYLQVC